MNNLQIKNKPKKPELHLLKKIFRGTGNGKYIFLIPSFQRGYRWTDHVTKLLDDLCEFSNKDYGNNDFYCLQPIVLHKIESGDAQIRKYYDDTTAQQYPEDNAQYYEVIDGQQRLTTIKLILQYINIKIDANMYELRYERSKDEEGTKLDQYYRKEAYGRIEKWFKSNPDNALDKDTNLELHKILYNHTKIIWQEMPVKNTDEALKQFQNINSRAISLSSSELVKAMLLNKKLYTDTGKEGDKLYRAGVWDEFTTYLENGDFKAFIGEMNLREVAADYLVELKYFESEGVDKTGDIPRIEVISSHYENILLRKRDTGKDPKNDKPEDVPKKVFNDLRDHFRNFQDWFTDPELYNYIGYLLNEKSAKVTPFDISKEYKKRDDKDSFRKWLKLKVYSTLDKNLKDIDISELRLDKNHGLIMKLLKVFSIRVSNNADEYFRFRPNGGWSVEHVFAQNMVIKKSDEKLEYLRKKIPLIDSVIDSARSNGKQREAVNELKQLKLDIKNCDGSDESKTDKLFGSFLNLVEYRGFGNNVDRDDYIHRIGNLALLGKNLNAKLSNNPFCEKRKILFDNNQSTHDFPVSAQMVFNKVFTTTHSDDGPYSIDLTLWANADCEAYEKAIKKEIDGLREEVG